MKYAAAMNFKQAVQTITDTTFCIIVYVSVPTDHCTSLYKGKGKGHSCTSTEALYRSYGL